jgi:hypothetical protein
MSLDYRLSILPDIWEDQPKENNMKKMIAILALASTTSFAQVANKLPEIEALPMDKLEALHWDCDYMASKQQMDAGDAGICSVVYERIKAEKFGGDFNKMLAWWNQNKSKQYALRDKK